MSQKLVICPFYKYLSATVTTRLGVRNKTWTTVVLLCFSSWSSWHHFTLLPRWWSVWRSGHKFHKPARFFIKITAFLFTSYLRLLFNHAQWRSNVHCWALGLWYCYVLKENHARFIFLSSKISFTLMSWPLSITETLLPQFFVTTVVFSGLL